MPSEDTKILEFNQYQKSDLAAFVIYASLDCLIEKVDQCKSNPENSFTTKAVEHIPPGFSMSTISSFKNIENTHTRSNFLNAAFHNFYFVSVRTLKKIYDRDFLQKLLTAESR